MHPFCNLQLDDFDEGVVHQLNSKRSTDEAAAAVRHVAHYDLANIQVQEGRALRERAAVQCGHLLAAACGRIMHISHVWVVLASVLARVMSGAAVRVRTVPQSASPKLQQQC